MITEPLDIVNVLIKPTSRTERIGNYVYGYVADKAKMFSKSYKLPIVLGDHKCMGINRDISEGMFSTVYMRSHDYRKGDLSVLDSFKNRQAKYKIADTIEMEM